MESRWREVRQLSKQSHTRILNSLLLTLTLLFFVCHSLFVILCCFLLSGDVLRAYATYSVSGIACDTAIHTFNAPEMHVPIKSAEMHINSFAPTLRRMRRPMNTSEDAFWTAAAAEAEDNTVQGICPGIAHDDEVLREAGTENSFVVSFENKTPAVSLTIHSTQSYHAMMNESADSLSCCFFVSFFSFSVNSIMSIFS